MRMPLSVRWLASFIWWSMYSAIPWPMCRVGLAGTSLTLLVALQQRYTRYPYDSYFYLSLETPLLINYKFHRPIGKQMARLSSQRLIEGLRSKRDLKRISAENWVKRRIEKSDVWRTNWENIEAAALPLWSATRAEIWAWWGLNRNNLQVVDKRLKL